MSTFLLRTLGLRALGVMRTKVDGGKYFMECLAPCDMEFVVFSIIVFPLVVRIIVAVTMVSRVNRDGFSRRASVDMVFVPKTPTGSGVARWLGCKCRSCKYNRSSDYGGNSRNFCELAHDSPFFNYKENPKFKILTSSSRFSTESKKAL